MNFKVINIKNFIYKTKSNNFNINNNNFMKDMVDWFVGFSGS